MPGRRPNYLILTLSTGRKRLVPVSKIYEHAARLQGRNVSEVEEMFAANPDLALQWTQEMRWLDAFPCRCGGGERLDWDREWMDGAKEIR